MVKILNTDIVGYIARSDRYREELIKSVSSSSSEFNEFDQERLRAYLKSLYTYLDHVCAEPQLDCPEAHPFEIEIPDHPENVIVESEDINDIIRILDIMRKELSGSQSARKSSGLIEFDEKRIRSLLEKIANFLTKYIAGSNPLDLPESSPQAVISGQGKQGI